MKIVISPAKSLDFKTNVPTNEATVPVFLDEANQLNTVLKTMKPSELSDLMHISAALGDLGWQRNQEWQSSGVSSQMRQAVYAFKGTAYVGLNAYAIPPDKIGSLQDKLRILSGQYGLLRPLDNIQAHRLEMGTKIAVDKHKNLYEFWGDKIANTLYKELAPGEVLVNLASQEYFKVLRPSLFKAPVISPVFKDYSKGKLKTIAFYAKRARGLMVRYIIDHNLDRPEDLKHFDTDGYAFDANLSTEKEWVFSR
ncbi:MAG: peroxide stress protein YaaA [Lutibacter sp.]|jgi:hypothetical protein|nr:peroxide stress protein YaaA [Lutibacter sp.]